MATQQGTAYTRNQSIEYRLWSRVLDNPDTGCWEWQGNLTRGGYGHIYWNRRNVYVHRVAWELCRGPIPEGLTVDHLCRVRHCVNPSHFELVPLSVNQSRQVHRNTLKTHCPQGHEYTPENTQLKYRPNRKNPSRSCRACASAQFKRWAERRKAS